MDNREYIRRLAAFLSENETTMAVTELADHLNRNNFKTGAGTEYRGKRGTYGMVSSLYDWLVAQGQQTDADNVAKAFPKPNGNYAYN